MLSSKACWGVSCPFGAWQEVQKVQGLGAGNSWGYEVSLDPCMKGTAGQVAPIIGAWQTLAFHIKGPEFWSFSIRPSNEYSGLISFRTDWLDLLAVQGTRWKDSWSLLLTCPAQWSSVLLGQERSHSGFLWCFCSCLASKSCLTLLWPHGL